MTPTASEICRILAERGGAQMTPTADESCRILAARIRAKKRTLFVRFGDGAIECMHPIPRKGVSCDGELYQNELAAALVGVMRTIDARCFQVWSSAEEVWRSTYFGDWRTATMGSPPQYVPEWVKTVRPLSRFLLHFESLLLNRQSAALVDFYAAVRADDRRKLFIGPCWNHGAARMLRANHFIVPDKNLFEHVNHMRQKIDELDPEVVLWGAGLAGNIPVIDHWSRHPDRTYIHLGSAMDPLFHGKTRNGQLPMPVLREMFKELL